MRRAICIEQVGPQPDPTDKLAQYVLVQRIGPNFLGGQVDHQSSAVIAEHLPFSLLPDWRIEGCYRRSSD